MSVAVDQGVVTLKVGRMTMTLATRSPTSSGGSKGAPRLNQMNTDEEVITAWEITARKSQKAWRLPCPEKWLLMLLALSIVGVSLGLARLFAANAETLLAPFVQTHCCVRSSVR